MHLDPREQFPGMSTLGRIGSPWRSARISLPKGYWKVGSNLQRSLCEVDVLIEDRVLKQGLCAQNPDILRTKARLAMKSWMCGAAMLIFSQVMGAQAPPQPDAPKPGPSAAIQG